MLAFLKCLCYRRT